MTPGLPRPRTHRVWKLEYHDDDGSRIETRECRRLWPLVRSTFPPLLPWAIRRRWNRLGGRFWDWAEDHEALINRADTWLLRAALVSSIALLLVTALAHRSNIVLAVVNLLYWRDKWQRRDQ